jgi:hypothetical protein
MREYPVFIVPTNISKLVSMNDLSMYGYISHDCHVMMMVFLAIAIRAIKPLHVKVIITCLCYFSIQFHRR